MTKVICLIPQDRFITTDTKIPDDFNFVFSETRDQNEIVELCKDADFLFVSSGTSFISAETIQRLDTIKMIQVDGVGHEKVDSGAAAALGLPVANNAGVNAKTVAECTVGMIIALQRRMILADKWIKEGRYRELHQRFVSEGMHELSGKKIGLIGLGAIGIELVKMLKVFDMEIFYFDIYFKEPEYEKELGISRLSKAEILKTCDIVSLHTPLTEETKNMLDEAALMSMKQTAILINTSRGEIVNQADLAKVLEKGHLAGVGIDTLHPEPPQPNHPLLNLSPAASERLMLTPHVAGITLGAFGRMLTWGMENMRRALANEPLRSVVNGVPKARKTNAD